MVKAVEATLFREAFHPQFNARRVQHVLAFVTLHLRAAVRR